MTATGTDGRAAEAYAAAAAVVDPELPMLTLADLGVLRDVEVSGARVVVTLTPTYTACPAYTTMQTDLRAALARAGFDEVEVRTRLSPAWSTDWISEEGRAALAAHGIAPPGAAADRGPVDLVLLRTVPTRCPRCGSHDVREVSRFGASPCTAAHVCRACAEPFDKVKEL